MRRLQQDWNAEPLIYFPVVRELYVIRPISHDPGCIDFACVFLSPLEYQPARLG